MSRFLWNPLTACKAAMTSLLILSKWSVPTRPSISLTLTPNFNASEHIVSLSAILVVQDARQVNSGDVLFEMKMIEGNVPSNDYQGSNSLKATDDNGVLSLSFSDTSNGMRYWYPSRLTEGIITAQFEAFPREVDEQTPVGPRVDLRMDQGGIIGAGNSFIPVPPNDDTIFDIHLNWNLTAAPDGTTVVCSFGDGAKSSKTGTVDILTTSTFMAGPIQKYTQKVALKYGVSETFGVYWFGSPRTFDIEQVARMSADLFAKMAQFFKDTEESYRIFVRFNPYRGFGGNGFLRSFVLEYDPYQIIEEDVLLYILAHEMVHNWPLMEQEAEGDSEEGAWYTEGIADYYSRILPYKFGLINEQQFIQAMNVEASSYYTNPNRELTDDEANERAWEDVEIQRLPYSRGAMYLFDANGKIMEKSGGARSIDKPVFELLRRQENRQKHGLKEWLHLMVQELGPSAEEDWKMMSRGELIVPISNAIGSDFKLVRSDQEPWELGFSSSSLSSRIIGGLIPGSRAAEAGLRVGDIIVRNDVVFNSADNYERNMTLLIKRGETEINVSYWPRKWEKVECWQWARHSEENSRLEL